jgi:adenylate cyclase
MGYGNGAAITAIGDAVNTASRLENLTKNFACELVVSEETASRSGLDLSGFPLHEIEIRGKRELLAVRIVERAAELPVPGTAPIRQTELVNA